MHRERSRRSGVILLVVLALLTLFALVGISFVLYADAASSAARLARDAEDAARPDVHPELLLAYFLGQLIYDAPDDGRGLDSALRGHSLARTMYGYDDATGAQNDKPYCGPGRLHTTPGEFASNPFGVDDYNLVNYVYFRGDGFVRDPERLGTRTGPGQAKGPFSGGHNAPYTAPDLNSLFLAAVRADGAVLVPSFHRAKTGFGALDPANPNWGPNPPPERKYQLLRPLPAHNPGFPKPEDAGGDVKNLIDSPGTLLADGTYANNDSIWIDLGFPVLTAPDGRRYKPLFAALVTDLDNRVNVNVHGNIRGQNQTHASNQGWGAWEVNLGRVLTKQRNGTDEWPALLLGSPTPAQVSRYGGTPWQNRYGTPGKPGDIAKEPSIPRTVPHFYAPIDFDGTDETNAFAVSGKIRPPDGTQPLSCFPQIGAGYGGDRTAEFTDHPLLFNLTQPAAGQRLYAASNLEALLRHGDTGTPALTSDLFRLCPANFADRRIRNLVTTHSYDLNKPGASPWLYDPADSGYAVATPGQPPRGPAVRSPDLARRNQAPPAGSEFSDKWRSLLPETLKHINLNRKLPPFPQANRHDDPAVQSDFLDAWNERQAFARELYDALKRVTGVPAPASAAAPTDVELLPLRWLAQLAVNIVDFIDEDDISTPFNFYDADGDAGTFDIGALDNGIPRYWVFGVELPRLVLNEVLAETQALNLNGMPTYRTNVWAELHNPFREPPPGTQVRDGLPVALKVDALPGQNNAFLPYQLVVADRLVNKPGVDVLGLPKNVLAQSAGETASDFGAAAELIGGGNQPAPTPSVARQSYFLFGPPGLDAQSTIRAVRDGGSVPDATPILRLDALRADTPDAPPGTVAVLLRRLANPNLPYNAEPVVGTSGDKQPNPWYNPYVTIDYLDGVSVQNVTASGAASTAYGKLQPYRSRPDELNAQNTFGRQNAPAPQKYDWLLHLDRPLISPAELLHVAACPPHRLTQQFDNSSTGHRAPWFDEATRIYRMLEFVETPSRAAGFDDPPGGRLPGKINLNTVWDYETLHALCDPQPSNGFNDMWVEAEWTRLQEARDLRPFQPFSTGVRPALNQDPQVPKGSGLEDTFLRSDAAGWGPLFVMPADHPYQRYELLTKIYNHLTTRSNVFAVWLTVGFFEVTDETTRPVKLGAEIGRAENRYVRHRMFALVDRSLLGYNPGPQPRFDPRVNPVDSSQPAPVLYFSVIQ